MGNFTVASNGNDVRSATGTSSLLNNNSPFTKLDVTNIASFQTIRLLFNREPPQAPATSPYYSNTLVYQFKHGYTYIPSVWMMWQNPSPSYPASPAVGTSNTTFFNFGDDSASTPCFDIINNNTAAISSYNYCALVTYNSSTGGDTTVTAGYLYSTADSSNVYIYFLKFTNATVGGSIIPLYMAGTTLNIRVYVFVEPDNTTSY